MLYEQHAPKAASMGVGLYSYPGGRQVICVFVKRTYDLVPGRRMSRSARGEIPLSYQPLEDDADGNELVPCLVAECDLIPRKLCTDIVVHGHARTPGGAPMQSMIAALRIGDHWKRVAVFGDRRVSWRPGLRPHFGTAAPFVELPLTWRRAFGGIDGSLVPPQPSNIVDLLSALDPEQHPGAFPPNPAGTGWVVNAEERILDGLRLPNFESPEHPLTADRLVYQTPENWVWAPEPAGFGWVSQNWFPRSTLAGAGPEHHELPAHARAGWLETGPHLDDGPDPRFFCGATAGLRRADLRGDEPIEMHGFHHTGQVLSALPGDRPDVTIAFLRRPLHASLRLHTIELFPDHEVASILWVAEATTPQVLPLNLPTRDFECFEALEGIDVLVDGDPVPRELMS